MVAAGKFFGQTREMMMYPGSDGAEGTARTVLQIVPRINRWAESRATNAEHGGELSLRQLSALSAIKDDTTTLGDIAKRLMVTPAVVTGLIDRLERRGYVRRVNSSGDRRRVLLALTDEGRAARGFVEEQLVSEIAQRLSGYNVDEVKDLGRVLAILSQVASDLEVPIEANESEIH